MYEHVVFRCQLLPVLVKRRPGCPDSILDFGRLLLPERDHLAQISDAFTSCQDFDFSNGEHPWVKIGCLSSRGFSATGHHLAHIAQQDVASSHVTRKCFSLWQVWLPFWFERVGSAACGRFRVPLCVAGASQCLEALVRCAHQRTYHSRVRCVTDCKRPPHCFPYSRRSPTHVSGAQAPKSSSDGPVSLLCIVVIFQSASDLRAPRRNTNSTQACPQHQDFPGRGAVPRVRL